MTSERTCNLCGEGMGSECGTEHYDCMCRESYLADQMPEVDPVSSDCPSTDGQ